MRVRDAPSRARCVCRKRVALSRALVTALVASERRVLVDRTAGRIGGQEGRVEGEVREGLVGIEREHAVDGRLGHIEHARGRRHAPEERVDPADGADQVARHGVEEAEREAQARGCSVETHLVEEIAQALRQHERTDAPTREPDNRNVQWARPAGLEQRPDAQCDLLALCAQSPSPDGACYPVGDATAVEAHLPT
jgi:hypothetical protein